MNMKARIKNIYFWTGILGAIGLALGISIENFTSWSGLGWAILESLKNPALVIPMIMTLIGILVDPSTGGWRDSNLEEEKELSDGVEDDE
jgi:phi LC3 family holin